MNFRLEETAESAAKAALLMLRRSNVGALREHIEGKTVAGCPHITVYSCGKPIQSLLDSGSHCSLLTEEYFKNEVRPRLGASDKDMLENHNFFKLSAAQGSEIPLVAYVELDIEYEGFTVDHVPFLITHKLATSGKNNSKKDLKPGVIGSNYLKLACLQVMNTFGVDVFKEEIRPEGLRVKLWHTLAMYFHNYMTPDADTDPAFTGWGTNFSKTEAEPIQIDSKQVLVNEGLPRAHILVGDPHKPVCIPASSGLTLLADLKAENGRLKRGEELLIESDGSQNLPPGIVVNSNFVTNRNGKAPVVLLNTTTKNIWIRQKLNAASGYEADLVRPEYNIEFKADETEVEIQITSSLSREIIDSVQADSGTKNTEENEDKTESKTTVTEEEPLPEFQEEPGYGEDFCFDTEVARLPFKLNLDDNVELSREEQIRFMRMIYANQNVFSLHEEDLGFCNQLEHKIEVQDPKPIYLPHRTVPYHLKEQVNDCLQHWLKQGIIRPSHSPYASQIVIVKKKDGKVRVCVDYRKLNNVVVRDAFPLPRIEETLNAVTECEYFTSFDLAQGYLQLAMDPESIKYTAFRAGSSALYEFTRMPFGLSNAVSTFSRLMEMCLGDQQFLTLLLYLDDICIFAKSVDEMMDRIELVFTRLSKFGLKLKPSKTFFFKKEVLFLGHVLSRSGIKPNPEKIDKIRDWPRPENVKELHSFLGLASYYRRFVTNFARIAGCLHALLGPTSGPKQRKNRKKKIQTHVYDPEAGIQWTDEHEKAFEELKEALITAPVLAYPDFTKPFTVEIDASFKGLGAILTQNDEAGKSHPVAYASRSLRPNERNMNNYSSAKLELLGLKWAVTEKFRDYLLGSRFTVLTDNNPLAYIKSSKLGAAMIRWVAELALFDFDIKYKPGRENQAADALSRRPGNPEEMPDDCDDEIAISYQIVCQLLTRHLDGEKIPLEFKEEFQRENFQTDDQLLIQTNAMNALPEITEAEMQVQQKQDPVLQVVIPYVMKGQKPTLQQVRQEPSKSVKRYLNQYDKLTLVKDVLFKTIITEGLEKQQLCLPNNLQYRLFVSLHRDSGHQSIERTSKLIAERAYWPGYINDITAWTKKCTRCLVAKAPYTQLRPKQGSIVAKNPMELICIDYTVLEKSATGLENVLVITDAFSKFTQALTTTNQTALTTAKALVEHWFLPYGIPSRIHSDKGKSFENQVVGHLCRMYKIEQTTTTPYNPRGNGICERFNRTLHNLLRTAQKDNKKNWPQHVPSLVMAYNATPNDTTGLQPYQLMFGRKISLPCDNWLGLQNYRIDPDKDPGIWIQEQEQLLRAANKRALKAIQKATEDNTLRAGGKELSIPVGNLVLLRNHPKGRNKTQDAYHNTMWRVIDNPQRNVYRIEPTKGGMSKLVNRREIKDCEQLAPEDRELEKELVERQDKTDATLGIPLQHGTPAKKPPKPVPRKHNLRKRTHPRLTEKEYRRPSRRHQLPARFREVWFEYDSEC